jgi:hypothetical protein
MQEARLKHDACRLKAQIVGAAGFFDKVLPNKENIWSDGELSYARQQAQSRQELAARHLRL